MTDPNRLPPTPDPRAADRRVGRRGLLLGGAGAGAAALATGGAAVSRADPAGPATGQFRATGEFTPYGEHQQPCCTNRPRRWR